MAVKFGLNYFLSVTSNTDPTQTIDIRPPFTVEFDIVRSVTGSLNSGNFRIYNLGEQTRNEMLKDFFDYSVDRTVIFQAGYGYSKNLTTLFYGTVFSAFSHREGVNYITDVTGQSGGFAVPKVYYTGAPFPKNASDKVVVEALVNVLATQGKLNVGFIGDFPNVSSRGRSYSLPVYDLLQEISGNGVFIDNNRINVMNDGESITQGEPVLIDSSIGLLATPRREQNNMLIPIIFTPEIIPGALINLQSKTLETAISSISTQTRNFTGSQNYNGLQKVNSVHHRGIISGSVSGETTTEVGIIYGIPAVAQ